MSTPDSVVLQRRSARLAMARMVLVILALGLLVPLVANAYWLKDRKSVV